MSDTQMDIKEEQQALASLIGHPGYKVLSAWMEREHRRCIQEMMDERKKEDNLRTVAREAKTYQKILQRVTSAQKQLRQEPF